jgi:hypothetical protein
MYLSANYAHFAEVLGVEKKHFGSRRTTKAKIGWLRSAAALILISIHPYTAYNMSSVQ